MELGDPRPNSSGAANGCGSPDFRLCRRSTRSQHSGSIHGCVTTRTRQDPTYSTPCYGTIWTPDGLASVSRYSIASDGMQSVSANCCAFIQYKFARMNVHGFV